MEINDFKDLSFKILFVDDDPVILKAFKGIFERNFNVILAINVDDAEKIIEEHEIGVVIVDYAMPKKNGIELLQSINTSFPHIRKIMISAHEDIDIIKNAVNLGQIHNFLHKPIDMNLLREIINEQVKAYISKMEEKGLQEINRIDAERYRKEVSNKNKLILDTINIKEDEIDVLGSKIGNILKSYFELMSSKLPELEQFPISLNERLIIKNILRNSELLVNEFYLPATQLLIQLISTNLSLLNGDITNAISYYERSIGLFQSITDILLVNKFNPYIEFNKFLNFNRDYDYDKFMPKIHKQLFGLLNFDVKSISEKSFQLNQKKPSVNIKAKIDYFLIMKNQLPIYSKVIHPRFKVDPILISNFITALNMLAQEAFLNQGILNAIIYDLGVILLNQPEPNIIYICLTNTETLKLRIGMLEFINETIDYIREIKENVMLKIDDKLISEKYKKYFKEEN